MFEESWLRTKDIHQHYKIDKEVGRGTYGTVYKARELKEDNHYVALKKMEFQKNDGFPITTLREIKLLQMLKHPSIVQLLEIIVSKPSVHNKQKSSTFLVFEYMEHDFVGLMQKKVQFSLA